MNPPVQAPKLPSAAYDNKIYSKFAANTIEKKAFNKEEFQKEFGLIPEKRTLLLGFAVPLTEKNGAEILSSILPGIEALGVQVALLGIGTQKYQEIMTAFANDDHTIAILENNDDNMRKLYAAVDAMLFLSKNQQNEQVLHNSLSYGVVPLAHKNFSADLLHDYNPNQEKGNSFLFDEYDMWHVYAALVRAIENYKFPYDWKNIAREGMNVV